jgi:glycosyltransferase involved in cell wall biosynthesis
MMNDIQKGMVSVIVASYNHARYLPRRMESLLSQTYANIEVIVIDDCSPDNSRSILRSYNYDHRVKLIERERNGGWVIVSNQGLSLAKGEYILFANCDDYCDNKMVEALVNGMKISDSIGVSFCRSQMVNGDDDVVGDDFVVRERSFRNRCKTDTLISASEMYRFFFHSCVIPNLSAALFRKECFSKVGTLSDSYKACCDWDLFFKIFASFDAYYVASPYNSFRQHNKTIRSSLKGRIEYEEFFRLLLSQINERNSLSLYERTKFRIHVMKLWCLHLSNSRDKGYKNFTYHFSVIWKYDKYSLLFFIPGVLARISELTIKFFKRRRFS